MHYDFDQDGTPIVYDQSGSNLNGTLKQFQEKTGAFSDLDVPGISGNAWIFPTPSNTQVIDSNRPFISFGDVVDPFDKSHTVSLWFNMNEYTANSTQTLDTHLVANSSTAIDNLLSGYNIFMEGNTKKIAFEVSEQLSFEDATHSGKKLRITGGEVIKKDTWYNVVLVIDREENEVRGYLNNILIGAQSLKEGGFIKGKPEGDRYTSGALGICTYKPKKYVPFAGLMDEFRVYSRALTEDEIGSLYNKPGDVLSVEKKKKKNGI